MADIVVEIKQGALIGFYTDMPDLKVVLVDWDNIERRDDEGIIGELIGVDSMASMPDEAIHAYNWASW